MVSDILAALVSNWSSGVVCVPLSDNLLSREDDSPGSGAKGQLTKKVKSGLNSSEYSLVLVVGCLQAPIL